MKLSSFPVLELSGADAVAFANAQFSNDVTALPDGQWQWNAWLNPQGRVRAFFALLRFDAQNLRLILRGEEPDALRDALVRFVLRAKVTIRVADESAFGVDSADTLRALGFETVAGSAIARNGDAAAIAMPDGGRWMVVGAKPANVDAPIDEARWCLADFRAGLPVIATALREEALPHWLGLIRLNAVSVKKGCYPGQEITSRLHFKGGNKRSLYRVTLAASAQPAAGTPVVAANGERVGLIVAACDGEALAVVAHASADEPLHVDEAEPIPLSVHERFG